MELIDLLKRPEGATLEYKRDLSSRTGIVHTAVAFANTSGGTILIGIEDSTARVIGVDDALDVEERIASLLSDSIEPRIVPTIEIHAFRKKHVIAIEVHPSGSRPHFVEKEGERAGTYVRVGSTNRRADTALVEEMRRFARGEAFDEQPLVDLDSEALDFRAASESFAGVRELKKSDLETLRLVIRQGRRRVPTVGGLILFGVNRFDRFPDAWIQVGRFDGTDRSKIIDQHELRSSLVRAIEDAVAFVERHTRREIAIEDLRRKHESSVPRVALREAIVNAVAHADYSQTGAPTRIAVYDDRVEIENPGLLPFGITLDDLRQGVSRLRNRVIGRVLHELGFMEHWGSGVQRMTRACREAGLADPEFTELAGRFRVTLSSRRQVDRPLALDATDQRILDVLEESAGLGTRSISEAIGLSTRSTRTRLASLVERGFVREIGSGPRDPRRVYVRSEATP